jgi:hypothetical protein
MRHSYPYTRGVICFTALAPTQLDQPPHQLGKLQEIGNAEQPAALADDDLWIGCNDVGPLLWHRADVVLVDAEQKPCPVSVVPLADADELPSVERVEWVGHAHKTCAWIRRACSSW